MASPKQNSQKTNLINKIINLLRKGEYTITSFGRRRTVTKNVAQICREQVSITLPEKHELKSDNDLREVLNNEKYSKLLKGFFEFLKKECHLWNDSKTEKKYGVASIDLIKLFKECFEEPIYSNPDNSISTYGFEGSESEREYTEIIGNSSSQYGFDVEHEPSKPPTPPHHSTNRRSPSPSPIVYDSSLGVTGLKKQIIEALETPTSKFVITIGYKDLLEKTLDSIEKETPQMMNQIHIYVRTGEEEKYTTVQGATTNNPSEILSGLIEKRFENYELIRDIITKLQELQKNPNHECFNKLQDEFTGFEDNIYTQIEGKYILKHYKELEAVLRLEQELDGFKNYLVYGCDAAGFSEEGITTLFKNCYHKQPVSTDTTKSQKIIDDYLKSNKKNYMLSKLSDENELLNTLKKLPGLLNSKIILDDLFKFLETGNPSYKVEFEYNGIPYKYSGFHELLTDSKEGSLQLGKYIKKPPPDYVVPPKNNDDPYLPPRLSKNDTEIGKLFAGQGFLGRVKGIKGGARKRTHKRSRQTSNRKLLQTHKRSRQTRRNQTSNRKLLQTRTHKRSRQTSNRKQKRSTQTSTQKRSTHRRSKKATRKNRK